MKHSMMEKRKKWLDMKTVLRTLLTFLLASMAFNSINVMGSSNTVYVLEVYWYKKFFAVSVESNSSLYNFAFSQQNKEISFFIAGPISTTNGFCNVTVPNTLLWLENSSDVWLVLIDDVTTIDLLVTENTTHTMLYFTYTHLTGHRVQIFGSGVIQPLHVHNINTGLDYVTIQEAINAPETLDGHEIEVDEGTYYEHVVVNKTVLLDGWGVYEACIIDGNRRPGTVVTITADNVVVGGFTIMNSGSQPEDAGIHLDNSDGTIVRSNILINNSIGISLVDSDNNVLEGNHLDHCEYRNIDLRNSHNNTIEINSMKKLGIQLWESHSNTLNKNKVFEAEYGISVRGNHNSITGNQFENNSVGINLQGNYSIITRNIIKSNIQYGIMLSGSDNVIYHNNFVSNAKQVWTNSSNSWDDGYPSGGNYWSDHPSVDWYSGTTQDILGSDGIGDTPYVIDTYNRDNYPLMMWPPPKIVVSFYPPTRTVMLDETFIVNITAANIVIDEVGNGLYAWDVWLKFDSKVLEVVEVTEGLFLKTVFNETTWEQNLTLPLIDNDAGMIKMGNTHMPVYPIPTSGATGNGTLAAVTFKALSVGATSLHFDMARLYSVVGNNVIQIGDFSPVFNADGIVTVIGSPFVNVTLDIIPKALNLQSKGKWVACRIELPEGYDVGDIDASAILLNDVVLAESSKICGKRLKISFDKSSVISLLPKVGEVELTVTGVLFDRTPFEGSDTIRVK